MDTRLLLLLATLGSLPLSTSFVSAEAPVRLRAPGRSNPADEGRFPTEARVAELVEHLHAYRRALAEFPVPREQRVAQSLLAEQASQAAEDLHRLSRTTIEPGSLAEAAEALDAALLALTDAREQLPGESASLDQALQRLWTAEARLQGALFPSTASGPVEARLRAQANLLRLLVLDVPGVDQTLLDPLRSFARRARRIALVDRATREVRHDYEGLAADWQAARRAFVQLLGAPPRVRLQATRVDALVRELGARQGLDFLGEGLPRTWTVARTDRVLVTGAGAGGGPRVRVFRDLRDEATPDFFAYAADFRGGVRVAVADLNGDGTPDIVTVPGPGMPPLVRVFDGRDLELSVEFLAFDPRFDGGLHVAAADLTPDGRALVAVAPGEGGGPHVKVFDLAHGKEVASFFAYAAHLRSGARLALGDVDGDGEPDLVTAPGPGGGPHVRVFRSSDWSAIADFMAYDAGWTGGVFVAVTDVRGLGRAKILTAPGAGAAGPVRVFDPVRRKRLAEFDPYPATYRGGVRVAVFDANGDDIPDIVCAPGSAAPLQVFDGTTHARLETLTPYGVHFDGGVFVAGQ